MGGHAFKGLYCPRISPDVYNKAKAQATAALQTVFAQVVVPTEMPGKDDYGDVDFLVCEPLHYRHNTTIDDFPWQSTVRLVKEVLDTTHGRRGYLTPDCMYFAIDAPHGEKSCFIQIDVKVCFKPELYTWSHFELNYASNSKMIGSMAKPLGLTIDPEGIHIRVEEIEETNFPGSMVWISRDPKDALRVVGLDRRILNAGFKTKDEIYEHFASSLLFHPGHFAARLAEEKYNERLEDRAPYWTPFIKEWVPEHYPGYCLIQRTTEIEQNDGRADEHVEEDLQVWYKRTRAALRDKVFTMFPHIATEYYTKRAAWLKEREEQKLRDLITKAISTGTNEWTDYVPHMDAVVRHPQFTTPNLLHVEIGEMTPPSTPPLTPSLSIATMSTGLNSPVLPASSFFPLFTPTLLQDTPLYIDALPRTPPVSFTPHPPPPNMSPAAKLLCLFRWTLFNPETGTPFLATTPREKDFQMLWTDAVFVGAADEVLVQWARDTWWCAWVRQAAVNYVGMWKRRFAKEDDKKKAKGLEEDVESGEKMLGTEAVVNGGGERVVKVKRRLAKLNEGLMTAA
ncbi:hypothetical protein G6011_07112 [Alternaria panax]|uniref:Uncharacterized protein n=1 Tax=Alternaria panax TaxID=48097 RepID=A0AAD4FA14_9PLEO|nr:hypothetical protein G6011_07112 [Alternaria panax]